MKSLVLIIILGIMSLMSYAGDPCNHVSNLIKVHVGLVQEVANAIK